MAGKQVFIEYHYVLSKYHAQCVYKYRNHVLTPMQSSWINKMNSYQSNWRPNKAALVILAEG